MNTHDELSVAAIQANIDYYRNLYNKHTAIAREHNQELWYWINVLQARDTLPKFYRDVI